MITDVDIKKMKKIFATKEDLKKFATKDELSELLELTQSFRSELLGLKGNIIDFKDSILSEIIKLREDVAVVTGYRDLIEDHGKRIEKLETAVYQ